MHIAIAGNIGSGKTTLTELLSKNYAWEACFEAVEDNPYLGDFYEDMQRWSFHLQIYFLNNRLNQVLKIRNSGKAVVQDRTIYEDAHVFAPNLCAMNLLSSRDFETYSSLFKSISSLIQAPDLLIYLRASVETLILQIKKRGRSYEQNISSDYLKLLNERYEAWISDYKLGKLLIIEVDNINFLKNKKHRKAIFSLIDKEIADLESKTNV